VARLLVISQVVALAPFSQNSQSRGTAGFAHAQLTHMKQSALFCFRITREPAKGLPVSRQALGKGF
jgi:hypothetical protein